MRTIPVPRTLIIIAYVGLLFGCSLQRQSVPMKESSSAIERPTMNDCSTWTRVEIEDQTKKPGNDHPLSSGPDSSYLTVYGFSLVELQITDPLGYKVGFDPKTREIARDVDRGSYGEEGEPCDGDDCPPYDPAKVIFIGSPKTGNYILNIFGTGSGSYEVLIKGERQNGITNIESRITGTAAPGMVNTYCIDYSPTGSVSLYRK